MPRAIGSLRILYLGPASGTSLDRALAMRRLRHEVDIIDPKALLPRRFKLAGLLNKMIHEFGGMFCSPFVSAALFRAVGGRRYDLIWVDGGDLISPHIIARLRAQVAPLVANYNVDDPFGLRDRNQWMCYLRSVPAYDLIAVIRSENVSEAQSRGARRVLRVFRSADEASHAPFLMSDLDLGRWRSEVLFVGTWMPGRDAFMRRLLELDVPLSIRGDRWNLAPEWKFLRRVWLGPGIYKRDYASAIQGAKISLGLLSKENRDLHTTRSLEIPALGGLLCAERTAEHLTLYKDGHEAVFWSSAEECADHCHRLLADDVARERIASAGQLRCGQNRTFNEPTMQRILMAAFGQLGADRMDGFTRLAQEGGR